MFVFLYSNPIDSCTLIQYLAVLMISLIDYNTLTIYSFSFLGGQLYHLE